MTPTDFLAFSPPLVTVTGTLMQLIMLLGPSYSPFNADILHGWARSQNAKCHPRHTHRTRDPNPFHCARLHFTRAAANRACVTEWCRIIYACLNFAPFCHLGQPMHSCLWNFHIKHLARTFFCMNLYRLKHCGQIVATR